MPAERETPFGNSSNSVTFGRVTAREVQSSLLLSGDNRSARVLILCGVTMVAAFGVLAWHSHRDLNAWSCLLLLAVAWAALGRAWRAAAHLGAAQILPIVWVFAAALRITAFVGAPVLEDDWFRYLWDGRQFATTGNPYHTPPIDHFADKSVPEEFQTVLSNINHPDVPTIYGPVCQYVFALSYGLAPARLWPLKLVLIVGDLLALWLLLKLTIPRHALLFAWCPLLIQESGFTAHPEILGVLSIVAALWARRAGRPILLALFCAAAVAARIHAVLLVPFLLWPLRGRPVVTFVAALSLLYLPFWLQGSAADLAGLKDLLADENKNNQFLADAVNFLRYVQSQTQVQYQNALAAMPVNSAQRKSREENLAKVMNGFPNLHKAGLVELRSLPKLKFPVRIKHRGDSAPQNVDVEMTGDMHIGPITVSLQQDGFVQVPEKDDDPPVFYVLPTSTAAEKAYITVDSSSMSEMTVANNWLGFYYYELDLLNPAVPGGVNAPLPPPTLPAPAISKRPDVEPFHGN